MGRLVPIVVVSPSSARLTLLRRRSGRASTPDSGRWNEPAVERSDTSGRPAPQGHGTPGGVRDSAGWQSDVGRGSGSPGAPFGGSLALADGGGPV